MRSQQISIFLENKAGRIAKVSSILASSKINIRALSLADTTDFGVLRLIVDNTREAEKVLKDAGFTVGQTHVIAVEVEDKPGGLNRILDVLSQADINVEYMYAFVRQAGENAIMIFRFDDTERAIETLQKNNLRVIDSETLHSL
ncbi:MAG: amino acid-binding protein [Deltaproteobacteria bacterium]|nr:MAG: amino acid-binding protein [Deltaproteobacteria bacterium]